MRPPDTKYYYTAVIGSYLIVFSLLWYKGNVLFGLVAGVPLTLYFLIPVIHNIYWLHLRLSQGAENQPRVAAILGIFVLRALLYAVVGSIVFEICFFGCLALNPTWGDSNFGFLLPLYLAPLSFGVTFFSSLVGWVFFWWKLRA